MYIGNGNTARKVVKAYIGVNGKAKQFWPSIQYKWNRYTLVTSTSYELKTTDINQTLTADENDSFADCVPDQINSEGWFTTRGFILAKYLIDMSVYSWIAEGVKPSVIYKVAPHATGQGNNVIIRLVSKQEAVSVTNYSRGTLIDSVVSSNRNAHPNNGHDNNYWYVYQGVVS